MEFFLNVGPNRRSAMSQENSNERLVRDSEPLLHALVEAAVDGIVIVDEQGLIETLTPPTAAMFGYGTAELIGKDLGQLLAHRPANPMSSFLKEFMGGIWSRTDSRDNELLGRHKNGTAFPMEWCVVEAPCHGRSVFVISLRNLMDRRRVAEHFRLVVESVPNAIVLVDSHGRIIFANSQAEEYFGYRREELLGQSVEVLVPPQSRAKHIAERAAFLGSPQSRPMGAGRDLFGLRKDGTEFPIEIGLNPIQTQTETLVLAAIVDITERKGAERALESSHQSLQTAVDELQAKNEEIRAMTQQLWQAAKLASVGELAASIAHELNNPLGTISLRIESILKNTPHEDPRRRLLEIVEQETTRMGELVANLLQFSRRHEEKSSTVDVRQELTKAVDLIHHHLRKQKVSIQQELSQETPYIFADRQKLRQVFLNLLANAADAMPEGGTLVLRCVPTSVADSIPSVLIEICDTGIGIPNENMAKVMEPFFTTKEEGKGTGLGLAICRRVVEDHGGEMDIESQVGVGTTVRLLLPVRSDANIVSLRTLT